MKRFFEFKQGLSQGKSLALGSVAFVVVGLSWCILSYGGFVSHVFLPTPTATFSTAVRMFSTEQFHRDILTSFSRVMIGFAISALVALPLGILMGSFKTVDALMTPFVGFIRYMPAAAFIPLLILWLGIGMAQKISVLFISIFFYLVVMVADATAVVQRDYIETAYTLGAGRRRVLTRVIIPAAMPGICDAMRVMMGVGWTTIVVAELVAAQSGIGAMIIEARRFLQTDKIIVGIVTIGILGMICDATFRILGRQLFAWKEK